MVNANDPAESFLNSIQAARDVFLPFESGIRKAVKDLLYSWVGTNLAYNNKDSNQNQICSVKKSDCHGFVHVEKKKGLRRKVSAKAMLGIFPHDKTGKSDKGSEEDAGNENDTCSNCLQFPVTWSFFPNGFLHSFSKPSKKHVRKNSGRNNEYVFACANSSKPHISREAKGGSRCQDTTLKQDYAKKMSIERLFGLICNQLLQNFQRLDLGVHLENNHLRDVSCTLEEKRTEIIGLLRNLRFARVGGLPSSIIGIASAKEEDNSKIAAGEKEDNGGNSPSKLADGLLNIPFSNVERLRSTLSTVSLTELIELVPQLGRSSKDYPDKKKLFSVQDFFRYTEAEGRRFFEELDRDDDGQVTLEDLEVVMIKRKLPRRYAREFLQRARNHLFSRSFGWKQFLSLMEQKESTILRAYTSLCLSKSGTLKKSEILESLKNAGLPANEDNAIAMMRFLNADSEESISYGHFRNFMVLLPFDRLQEDPRSIWFEAATVVAVPPPVDIPASSVLKSALAGGLSCALSCSLLYPVDTMKTRVQASTLTFPDIISKLPQIGVRGLYRGSVPAILGQFSSHGLRTGIFEASKLVLVNVAPTLPALQVQSIASFCSTLLGTVVRIPNEVLKQRLQAGLFDNVGEAIVGTWNQDGLKGFFRGTGATLFREVPFYVAGMGLYAESKKGVEHLLGRELEPWETIAVGAISGGFAAVVTTPFDVMKTRMMTAPGGRSISMQLVAMSILRREGPLGLFKGAVPRFFWIAPLGAMNFAGYELAKKAMERNEEQQARQLS